MLFLIARADLSFKDIQYIPGNGKCCILDFYNSRETGFSKLISAIPGESGKQFSFTTKPFFIFPTEENDIPKCKYKTFQTFNEKNTNSEVNSKNSCRSIAVLSKHLEIRKSSKLCLLSFHSNFIMRQIKNAQSSQTNEHRNLRATFLHSSKGFLLENFCLWFSRWLLFSLKPIDDTLNNQQQTIPQIKSSYPNPQMRSIIIIIIIRIVLQ